MLSTVPDCRPLLAGPDDLTLVFQPVVELASGEVAGYEALSRFPGTASPDVWFAAARQAGIAAELEALVVLKALAALDDLPPGTFLSVNVTPSLLSTPSVSRALAARPGLDRLVVEFTEHAPLPDLAELRRAVDALRSRGARVAVDDAGSGVSGLRQLTALRPELLKLDNSLVTGVESDPPRMALVEMLVAFAGRIGARVAAEGLEQPSELAVLGRLGVPLGQGWLLGRPLPEFLPPTAEAVRLARSSSARAKLGASVAGLLRPVRVCTATDDTGPTPAAVVGGNGEPYALLLTDPRTGTTHLVPLTLRVHPLADVADTLARAVARPPAHRFDPVLCCDPAGAPIGVVRVEDLATAAVKGA
jgi:EAL domain-containing protein (putative c-di-GMP-specific phosphodiesterase class I)